MKYNRTREDRFQIRTEIREKNGTCEVGRRRSIRRKGAHPVLQQKYQVFDQPNPSLETGKTGASGRGNDSGISVFRGKTRAEPLGEILTAQGADAEVSAIRAAMDEIYSIRPENAKPFAVTHRNLSRYLMRYELDSYRDKETEKWRRMGFFRGSSCGRELQRLQH